MGISTATVIWRFYVQRDEVKWEEAIVTKIEKEQGTRMEGANVAA